MQSIPLLYDTQEPVLQKHNHNIKISLSHTPRIWTALHLRSENNKTQHNSTRPANTLDILCNSINSLIVLF